MIWRCCTCNVPSQKLNYLLQSCTLLRLPITGQQLRWKLGLQAKKSGHQETSEPNSTKSTCKFTSLHRATTKHNTKKDLFSVANHLPSCSTGIDACIREIASDTMYETARLPCLLTSLSRHCDLGMSSNPLVSVSTVTPKQKKKMGERLLWNVSFLL